MRLAKQLRLQPHINANIFSPWFSNKPSLWHSFCDRTLSEREHIISDALICRLLFWPWKLSSYFKPVNWHAWKRTSINYKYVICIRVNDKIIKKINSDFKLVNSLYSCRKITNRGSRGKYIFGLGRFYFGLFYVRGGGDWMEYNFGSVLSNNPIYHVLQRTCVWNGTVWLPKTSIRAAYETL